MFKDTVDGQTYFDPEAEQKAREKCEHNLIPHKTYAKTGGYMLENWRTDVVLDYFCSKCNEIITPTKNEKKDI